MGWGQIWTPKHSEGAGHEAWAGAVARQGRHHDPIGELEGADLHALEQRLDG
jgi:hypothetical protein